MVDEELFYPYMGKRVGTVESIIGLPMDLLVELLAQAGWTGAGR